MSAIIWYAKQVMDKVEAQVQQNMDKAAILLQGEVVKSFGSPQALPEGYNLYNQRGKKITEKRFRSGQHSAPGEPPYVQSGMLRRSITWMAPAKLIRLVGSALKPQGSQGSHSYAWYLEYGTSKMAARPYLLPALRRLRGQLFRIIATGN
jgi:hypothetical protein